MGRYLGADHADACAFAVVSKPDKYDADPLGPVRKGKNKLERLDARSKKVREATLKIADRRTGRNVGEELRPRTSRLPR
jgi:hypothetical protein